MLAVVYFAFDPQVDSYYYFREHRAVHETLKDAMFLVSDFGNPVFWIAYAAMLAAGLYRRDRFLTRFALVYLAVQLVISFGLVHLVKFTLGRPRPGLGLFYQPFSFTPGYDSLPSGHTAEIYGASLPLAAFFSRWWVTLSLGLFAALVAFSRIYLGRHHPGDVFFGWIFGCLSGAAIIWLAGVLAARRQT